MLRPDAFATSARPYIDYAWYIVRSQSRIPNVSNEHRSAMIAQTVMRVGAKALSYYLIHDFLGAS